MLPFLSVDMLSCMDMCVTGTCSVYRHESACVRVSVYARVFMFLRAVQVLMLHG